MTAALAHQQTLQEIGHMLLAKRLERGLSIEDVASSTNLRIFFLKCMEEGRFDQLPGGIYTAGLAKLYMSWLGFDDKQCQEWINQLQPQYVEEEKKLFASEKPISKISLPIWISVGAVALIVVLLIASSGKEKKNEEPSAFIVDSDKTGEDETDKANASSTLALYVRGTTWIKITDANNNVIHTQLAKKGATVDLTPYIGKKLTVGDGRQVVIYHNGEEVGPLSEPSVDSAPVLVENTPIQVEP